MPDVRIVDLEIIKRFSLAVRTEFADADDVLEALEASLDEARAAAEGRRKRRRTSRGKSASRSKKPAARKSAARKASAKRASSGGRK